MVQRITEVLRTSSRPYLFVIVLAVVLGRFAQYLWQYVWPSIPLIYGQAPEIYVKAFGVLAAALLWLVYQGSRTRQPLLVAFLLTLSVGWFILGGLAKLHGDVFTYDSLVYVPVLVALLLKTPTVADLLAALRLLGWTVVIIFVGTRAAEMTGLIPMVDVGPDFLAFETANYWLPLSGTLGPEGRWPGPMGHNAMTGNAAAMLVVLAFGLRGRSRWVFGLVGVLVLLLTASRGSQIAAAAGVLAIIVLGDNPLTRRVRRSWLLLVLGSLALITLAAVLARNPNLTGRTTYWSLAVDLWRESPLTGSGSSGLVASDLYIAGSNAHNLVFDALVKYGLIGTALVLVVLGMSGVMAWKASSAGMALASGIFVTYTVIGLAESDQGWLTLSLPWLWLVLASLLAGRQVEESIPMPTPSPVSLDAPTADALQERT